MPLASPQRSALRDAENRLSDDQSSHPPWGAGLAQKVNEQFDRLLYHLLEEHHGLVRVSPEWLWRDFRLRLSRGRNQGSSERLERAALLWMVYHNLTPTQKRSERKRHYKHPGQSPLEVAGRPQAKSLTWMCCRSERTSLFPRCFQTGKQGDRHLYPRQANRSPTNTFVFSST